MLSVLTSSKPLPHLGCSDISLSSLLRAQQEVWRQIHLRKQHWVLGKQKQTETCAKKVANGNRWEANEILVLSSKSSHVLQGSTSSLDDPKEDQERDHWWVQWEALLSCDILQGYDAATEHSKIVPLKCSPLPAKCPSQNSSPYRVVFVPSNYPAWGWFYNARLPQTHAPLS